MPLPSKPAGLFDRQAEWDDLARFAADPSQGASLGVVSGRRRQGKTFLLYSLAQAAGGFYFAATEATETESLRRLGAELGRFTGSPAPLDLPGWEEAVDALLALGRERPVLVVLDEFPYLVSASPSLPSILQRALSPGRPERTGSRTRLVLCGSSMSFMGRLLGGTAPLRGRASLELLVHPFGYRQAASFWQVVDPRLAVLVNAVVGGTPAYRYEYTRDDAPMSLEDFDSWVARAVLNPASPMFREARYLLAEDTALRDPGLYHSVLAAVAEGNARRGGIASYVGRKATDIAHPLTVLEDSGLVCRVPDLLHAGRSTFQIAEPLIAFYEAIMRPEWTRLERRQGEAVWRRSKPRFESAVVGPRFEEICRDWVADVADLESVGGHVDQVGQGVVNDAAQRTSHEIDVLAISAQSGEPRRVLLLGEAKWGVAMGAGHLARLERVRELLARRPDVDASGARFACFSGVGFSPELLRAGERSDVLLVDPERLYSGR